MIRTRKVITVNQCFELLVRVASLCQSWPDALLTVIPRRKGALPRRQEGEAGGEVEAGQEVPDGVEVEASEELPTGREVEVLEQVQAEEDVEAVREIGAVKEVKEIDICVIEEETDGTRTK